MEIFKKHLNLIKKNNYNFYNPQEFNLYFNKPKLNKKILITIDDAFSSFYENAWPLLKKNKVPFILFVSTEPVGKHGYMTWDQLREIEKENFVFLGNHSHSHEYMINFEFEKLGKFKRLLERVFLVDILILMPLLSILLLFSWVSLVGVVRAEFLRARNFEYVLAARALGISNIKIMYKHLLPNAMVATITFMPFILNGSIVTLTSLDFLGFGLPPGSASLGELLAQGKNNIHAPWLGITSFFGIAILLSLLIFVGEGVRDAFDPRKGNMV